MRKTLLSILLLFFVFTQLSAQLAATVNGTNPTCLNNNGSATVTPTGASGYTYKWSNGATTATANNLAAGTYTVTVYSSAGAIWDTIYFEQFEGTHNWSLNMSTGTNGPDNNYWVVNGNTGGGAVGACSVANASDKTLHVTSVAQPNTGARYDAGGLCGLLYCPETNMAVNSPTINTAGVTNLVLRYDFIGNGDGLTDNASSFYSINSGANFTSLDASLKSTVCNSNKGNWIQRSYNLPASCNNISTLMFQLNWTNNDDGAGSDPSFAVNNILLRDSLPGTADSVVQMVTLTLPTGPHFVTAALSVVNPGCGLQNGSINNMGIAGGTTPYTLAWKTGGASIGSGNSLTNLGAGTYTLEATDANGCMIDTSITLVATGTGGPATITATKDTFCTGDTSRLCISGSAASYQWNTGATTNCISVTAAGNYYVTVTYVGGCTAESNHLSITVHQSPPVSISVQGDTLSAYGAASYQWYINGNEINSATDSVYIATQAGVYTVQVTDSKGCTATSLGVTISGVDEMLNAGSGIRVSPNPFTDELTIYNLKPVQQQMLLEVFNVSGRKIFSSVLLNNRYYMYTSGWSPGVYFLKVGSIVYRLNKY